MYYSLGIQIRICGANFTFLIENVFKLYIEEFFIYQSFFLGKVEKIGGGIHDPPEKGMEGLVLA